MLKKSYQRKKGDCLYCYTPVPEEVVKCEVCEFPHRGTIKNKVSFSKQLRAKQGDYAMYSVCKGVTGIGFFLYSWYYLDILGRLYFEDNRLYDVFLLSLIGLMVSSVLVFFYQRIGSIGIILCFFLNLFLGVLAFDSEYLAYDVPTRGILIFTLAITFFRVKHHIELRKYLKLIKRKSKENSVLGLYTEVFSGFL